MSLRIDWPREKRRILLPIIVLRPYPVTDLSGTEATALIDTGSSVSGVSANVAQSLGLVGLGKRPLKSAQGEGQAERYAFRTPPLRNVELTAPYGHDGAFFSLRDFVAHYSESDVKLHAFDASGLEPALQSTLLRNFDDILATRDPLLQGVVELERR